MRTDHTWFQRRFGTTWKAQPGRSCLLIVPPGCDTLRIANEVVTWSRANDPIAAAYENRRAVVVRLTTDAVTSSSHFVERVGRELGRSIISVSQVSKERYAADWLENLIGAAQHDGNHPILVIDRFHAFASIADDHLLSVLSTMRQLEHDGQLSTIAISPMNYQSIRTELSLRGKFPFVNSAYGDNHDQMVLPPLSRAEFVASAVLAGLDSAQAQKLFALAGGPDCVHSAIIAAAATDMEDVVGRSARSLGDSMERFFDLAVGPRLADGDDLRLRVATGRLQPAQLAYLRHLDLADFLLKQDKAGRTVLASPVLGRLLLTGRQGPWIAFARVLEALSNDRYADAARQAQLLEQSSPHLEAFTSLVTLLAAIHDNDTGGLLEIDWRTVQRVGRKLLDGNLPIEAHRAWVDQLVRWSDRVGNALEPSQGRGSRLDVLARQAGDPDVRMLLQYSIRAFLGRVRKSGSPAEQIRSAGSVPEAILQSLCAYLGLDPLDAPNELPDLNYQRFFNNVGDYRRPTPGSRLDLTHLLVIVPALLASRCSDFSDEIQLCNAQFVRPLHQRLTLQIRNATAHTYADMDEADATFFFKICDNFLADAAAIWGRDGTGTPCPEPDQGALADLLHGFIVTA
ncbi:hypothetical protein [uncultured Mesorhizobium sp.]|uniref:hypothetical protein n=1 Tax=unclassified Mesorhizobium TaxID=325217 RepID=UPI000AD0CD33